MKDANQDMTFGNPLKLIIAFAIPVFISSLFQQVYTVADTAIVSKTLGAEALAAVGSIGSVNFLILGFCNGMGMGFSIPIAQKFGAKEENELKNYAGNSLWVYLIVSVIFTFLSCLFCRNILEITKTPSNIIEMAYDYLFVIFLGIPVQFAYNTLSSIIRALGDSKTPLYILIFSSILNIGLDLVFIIVFSMGTRGAAVATVLSELVSVIGCLMLIKMRIPVLMVKKENLKPQATYIKGLLKDGLPMALQMSVTGIGSILLQTSVNVLGSVAVAAVTAAERIGNLAAVPTTSLASAMSVYCGQNLGAKKYDRITKGVKTGVALGLGLSVLAAFILVVFGKKLTLIFLDADTTELIDMTYTYLVIVGLFLWAQSLIFSVRFSIQGLGYGNIALAACVLEMVARSAFGLFVIPKFGFTAAGFSSPAAWIMADLLLIPSLIKIIKSWKK